MPTHYYQAIEVLQMHTNKQPKQTQHSVLMPFKLRANKLS